MEIKFFLCVFVFVLLSQVMAFFYLREFIKSDPSLGGRSSLYYYLTSFLAATLYLLMLFINSVSHKEIRPSALKAFIAYVSGLILITGIVWFDGSASFFEALKETLLGFLAWFVIGYVIVGICENIRTGELFEP